MGHDEASESVTKSEDVPVLVLGSHRSGTSAITGLLAEAGGLVLGDVMPPTTANPKGYFESVAIVKAHNEILAALDRDWTCPPACLDPTTVQLDGVEGELAALRADGGTWGLKDPRLLYMLPIWAQLLPAVRFVGVIRDHEEVVRSLAVRDGLDAAVADQVTRAHVRRLRILRETFQFPIIDFSASPEDVLARTEAVARSIGLDWAPDVAQSFLDSSLTGQRSRGLLDNEDIDRLRAFGVASGETEIVTSAQLRTALGALADQEEEFDRYSGPRTNARRATLWRGIPSEISDVVEVVRNLRIAASRNPAQGRDAVECIDLWSMHRALTTRRPRPQALLFPDLTSWVDGTDLCSAMALIREQVAPDGLVIVGLSQADTDTRRVMGREATTVDEVLDAARASGLTVLSVSGDDRLKIVRLLVAASTTSLLRSIHEEGIEVRGEWSGPTPRVSIENVAPPPPSLVDHKASDDGVWERRYRRLRSRRSVRVALALSAPMRPLFRVFRGLRKRTSDG